MKNDNKKEILDKVANILIITLIIYTLISIIFVLITGEESFTEFRKKSGMFMLINYVIVFMILIFCQNGYINKDILLQNQKMKVGIFICSIGGMFVLQIFSSLFIDILNAILQRAGLILRGAYVDGAIRSTTLSMLIYGCLVAPIFEELIFRGIILDLLRAFGEKAAIILSAFLFGIYHGNISQGIYAFLVGIILSYIATKYSIYWAVVMHILNNSLAEIIIRINALDFMCLKVLESIFIMILSLCFIIKCCKNIKKVKREIRYNEKGLQIKDLFLSKRLVAIVMLFIIETLTEIGKI